MEPLLTEATRTTAGILLLAIVTIAYGGTHVLRISRGTFPATELQEKFSRAGHAHAGVLVLLSLVALLYVDAAGLDGALPALARLAIPASAILVPLGFFLSVAGRDVEVPNRLIAFLWAGVASLVVGVASLGVALVTA